MRASVTNSPAPANYGERGTSNERAIRPPQLAHHFTALAAGPPDHGQPHWCPRRCQVLGGARSPALGLAGELRGRRGQRRTPARDSAMRSRRNTWAVVLAAGDGTRLASLTADEQGNAVPKQYCSLHGEASLLQEALRRARPIAPRSRQCVIVAEQHRPHWRHLQWSLAEANLIVQPRNCGTAHGILLVTLQILRRDPQAHIVFLPADHHVTDEPALARSLEQLASRAGRELLLLGIAPEEADPELGYIVPGAAQADGCRAVQRFVEKPQPEFARELIGRGALWNSFIFAADGAMLLQMLRSHMPGTVAAMARAVADHDAAALESLYAQLVAVDFSRSIIQGAEQRIRVLAAAACGWSDLGTPQRVGKALRRAANPRIMRSGRAAAMPALINLARQLERAPLSA
jgi:mannose-1-phosphate guanylyltransferase